MELFQALQMGVPVVLVTGQREIPGDSIGGDKLLEQRRRKLDGLSGGASNQNVPGCPAIIIQILFRRDAEVKFVSVHGISALPAIPESDRKATSSSSRSGVKCLGREPRMNTDGPSHFVVS